MQFHDGKSLNAVLLGVGILILLLFIISVSNKSIRFTPLDDTLRILDKKREIVTRIRVNLLKSVEMEKNAVIALTDEESQNFADQSHASSAAVDQNLKQLGSLIDEAPHQDEKELVIEFNTSWTKLQKIDHVILELAVQNTNLKAASLSRSKGFEAVQRFEDALKDILRSYSGAPNEGRVARLICYAMTSGLKIYTMHSFHIAEESDVKMDQIEAQMKLDEKETSKSLDELSRIMSEKNRHDLMQAKTAFSEFMEVTAITIALSRQNTNIKSLELSLGRKRKISAQCDEILATFQKTIQNRTFKATR